MGGDGGVIAVKREFVRGCRNKAEEEAKVTLALCAYYALRASL